MKIDIIIPTYKPGKEFIELVSRLKSQSIKPEKVIVINTEEKYYEKLKYDNGNKLDSDFVEVYHISKREFDHGKTRNRGVKKSTAEIFVMMTQDAMPVDEFFIENLIKPFENEKVAASFARQLARPDSSLVEQVTREFNYPDKAYVKDAGDVEKMGIKAFFCSNVSCAYKREVFEELGGFVNKAIFNEDMIYAASVIRAGYSIAYAADACVYHSHNYSASEQFHRNVDIGISQADHPEVFEGLSSESEGKKMVLTTIKRLKDARQVGKIIPYIYMSGCKFLGYKIGKSYKKLPVGFIKRCSMNPDYFN